VTIQNLFGNVASHHRWSHFIRFPMPYMHIHALFATDGRDDVAEAIRTGLLVIGRVASASCVIGS
jgi:hypothetical protein